MLDRLFNFFIQKSFYQGLPVVQQIEYLGRARLVVLINLFASILILAIFTTQMISIQQKTLSLLLIPFTALCLMASLFYFKKSGDPTAAHWSSLILIITILPIRAYYGGGAQAGILSWYFTALIVISSMHTRRVLIGFSVIAFVQILVLFLIPVPPSNITATTITMTCLMAFTMSTLALWSMRKVNDLLVKESTDLEREKTLNILITTLCHEIRNPLAIAKGRLDLCMKKNSFDGMDKVDDALGRIDKIVAEISHVYDFTDEDLVDYSINSKMIKLKKEQQGKENENNS